MNRKVVDGDDGEFHEQTQSEEDFIRDMTADTGKMHLITMPIMRPGSITFTGLIEYHWYPPADPILNDQFEVRSRIWEDMVFNVISFPMERKSDAHVMASHFGLRIGDGVPTILSDDPADRTILSFKSEVIRGRFFPGSILPNGQNNPRMFTLESGGERIATNLSPKEVGWRETRLLNKFGEGVMLRPREASHFIFGNGEFANPYFVQYFLEMTHIELARLQNRL